MTQEKAKQLLPLIQAVADGKTIQLERLPGKWEDVTNPSFLNSPSSYRIKPEPKPEPREFIIHEWGYERVGTSGVFLGERIRVREIID